MGDATSGPIRLSFNPQLRVEFRGATVTSDAGLLLPRELDERLGWSALIEQHLTDPRTGHNRQLPLPDLFRQSFYNQRGTAEQWIKEGKAAIHWTRLSCHRFRANEVRLLLGVIAYNVGNLLRRLVLPVAIRSWSLTSLQQRLFRTGGRLIRHARYFILQLAESQLTQRLFAQIIRRIERLAWHPT